MKKNYILSVALALIVGFANAETARVHQKSASKTKSANTTDLSGTIDGTLAEGTYNLVGDLLVEPGHTWTISPGVKILATGNYRIEIGGDFICNGTEEKPITFTASDIETAYDSLGKSGWWGGILCDSSALDVQVTFTHIDYTGGIDATGGTQASFDVEGTQGYNGGAKIIFEDNWMFGGIDDAIHLAGNITCSVKRNILQRLGGPDGDLVNIKAGAHGDFCYNYIWSSANSGFKLNTGKKILSPETIWNVYNNTFIDGNWRKEGELSSAILIDQFSSAHIYNNVIVGCRNGINITTKADTVHAKYGNNLIYTYSTTVDSFTNNYYIPNSFGKVQPSDKVDVGLTACGTVFTHWDSDITVDTADFNIPTLTAGSAAIGTGTTTESLLFANFQGVARIGSTMAMNVDMGAYPKDNNGNKNMPTPYPGFIAPVSIHLISDIQGLSVYPNPVIDELNVTSQSVGMIQVDIIDMQGKVVLSKTNENANQLSLNVSNLSRGLYVCRVIQGSTTATSKFFKN